MPESASSGSETPVPGAANRPPGQAARGRQRARRDAASQGARGAGQGRHQRRPRPRSGHLFLVMVAFVLVLVPFIFKPEQLFNVFFSKQAGVILILMVIQFLVLKSTDRTRVYELENNKLRDQRRMDRALMKRAKDLIEEERAIDPQAEGAQEQKEAWRERARAISEELGRRA